MGDACERCGRPRAPHKGHWGRPSFKEADYCWGSDDTDCAGTLIPWRARALVAEQRAEAAEAHAARLRDEIDVLRQVAPVCSECDGDFSSTNPPHDYGDVWCCSACVSGFERAEIEGEPNDERKGGGA